MSSIAKTNSAFNSLKNFFSTIFAVDIKDQKDEFDVFINGSNEEDAKIALKLQASLLDIDKKAEEFTDSKPKKKKNLSLNNKVKLEKQNKNIVKEEDERDISK